MRNPPSNQHSMRARTHQRLCGPHPAGVAPNSERGRARVSVRQNRSARRGIGFQQNQKRRSDFNTINFHGEVRAFTGSDQVGLNRTIQDPDEPPGSCCRQKFRGSCYVGNKRNANSEYQFRSASCALAPPDGEDSLFFILIPAASVARQRHRHA